MEFDVCSVVCLAGTRGGAVLGSLRSAGSVSGPLLHTGSSSVFPPEQSLWHFSIDLLHCLPHRRPPHRI